MKAANDDDPLPFLTIAAATANVLAYLDPDKQKHEHCERNAERSDEDEAADRRKREYVEQRLREIAAFERRACGAWKRKDRRGR